MALQERSFTEVFGEIPEPSNEVSPQSIRAVLFGASILLQEDPSESAIEDTIRFLSTKPKSYLEKASDSLTYDSDLRESTDDNPLKLVRDIVTTLYHAYLYDSDSFESEGLPETFDPKVEAQNMIDLAWLSSEDKKWEVVGEQLVGEKDKTKRTQLALQIKQNVMDYISQNPVQFMGGRTSRKMIPKWENISVGGRAEMKLRNPQWQMQGEMTAFDRARREAGKVLKRDELDATLDKLPKLDKELFDGLRKTFGAKAANLLILQDVNVEIKRLLLGDEFISSQIPSMGAFTVPEFIPVPVDIYNKWSSGEDIDEDIQPYFEWTKQQVIDGGGYYEDELESYIVRSSAVHSEDGEKLSGAGIYESVVVPEKETGSYEAFKNAVIKVFESTNSPKAQSYRAENGVDMEEMGLVIQKHVPEKYEWRSSERTHMITVNSSAAGIDELTEIIEDDARFFVRKDILDQNLASKVPDSAVHFRPDRSGYKRNILYNEALIRYAVTALLLESIWDGRIQMECVEDYLVQVRRVADNYDGEMVKFPDEKEILRGSGIGVGDKTLKVLSSHTNNSELKGAVQFRRNWEWSLRGDPSSLPKEGAVVVQEAIRDGNGHLQTLCVEKGLLCLYPNENSEELEIPALKKGVEVRIVSNGVEARLYQVGDENPLVETNNYND